MPEPLPVPVVVCDGCGHATPSAFRWSPGGRGPISPEQREKELLGQGWLLAPTRDLCPACRLHATERTPAHG